MGPSKTIQTTVFILDQDSSMDFTEDRCSVTAGDFTEAEMINLLHKILTEINHYTSYFFFHIFK